MQRREQRDAAHTDLQGVLAPWPRQSIEPMGLAVDGVAPTAVRALQALISAGPWKDERLRHQHWHAVETDLGADDGVLLVDGSAFPKQGGHAVGVKRQDCGALGQRAPCQAGVFVGSGSCRGSPWLDRRVYVPVEWRTANVYAERRRPCGIPAALTCTTTPELAQAMRAALVQTQTLRCRGVVADEAFGGHPGLLEGVAGLRRWDFAEVPHPTRVWDARPATPVPPWRGRGRRPQRAGLVEGAPAARTVLEGATVLPAEAWTRQTITEGSQGPLGAECAPLRGVAVRDALPGPAVWVGRRRHLETGALKTSRCNAPIDIALETPGRMSGMRWPMATCCADRKPRLGMGAYDIRRWTGWPQHMTLVILAHFLVVRLRLR